MFATAASSAPPYKKPSLLSDLSGKHCPSSALTTEGGQQACSDGETEHARGERGGGGGVGGGDGSGGGVDGGAADASEARVMMQISPGINGLGLRHGAAFRAPEWGSDPGGREPNARNSRVHALNDEIPGRIGKLIPVSRCVALA